MLIDNTVWVQHSEIRCETSTQKRLKEAPILGLSILRKICCEPFSWFKRPVEKSNYTRPLETHVAFDVFVSRLVSRQAHRLKSHLGLLKELTNNMAFRGPRVEARFTTVHRCHGGFQVAKTWRIFIPSIPKNPCNGYPEGNLPTLVQKYLGGYSNPCYWVHDHDMI